MSRPLIRVHGIMTAVILFMTLSLVPYSCSRAESPVRIILTEKEWSWIPGEVATFSGTITCDDHDQLSGASIQLEIIPEPKDDDPGRIVFTSINGKRIKIRKQSETYILDDSDLNDEILFEGSWFIPEGSAFFKAGLVASVAGKSGDLLGTCTINVGTGDSESTHSLLRIPVDIGHVNFILALCTGAVCCLAVCRFIVLLHRKKSIHAKEF